MRLSLESNLPAYVSLKLCHSAGHLIQLLAESSFLRVEGPFPTGPNKAINGFEICQRLGRQIAIQEPFETKRSI